ncbi:leishmanolysin-related zinc metalloendopeptidase [Thioclava kandeliae]|uniref:Leishmanolysin-related zinc metalloendopeptidase n=1 Tax=Thioclava kandeliae TaxID=3070818 RepID=A0ABV1SF92_9RHOB
MRLFFTALAVLWSCAVHAATTSDFKISLYLNGYTDEQSAIMQSAADFWGEVITGYQDDVPLTGVSIYAQTASLSSSVIASAGPVGGYWSENYLYARNGVMKFSTSYLSSLTKSGRLYWVALHEMAHVLGFGTLWTANGLYDAGSGEYTGAAALAAYRAECDASASYVPVELGGGSGTANSHWDEAWGCGSGEVLTGYIASSMYLSVTSRAAFVDLGYTVADYLNEPIPAVPLPATAWLLLCAIGALYLLRVTVTVRMNASEREQNAGKTVFLT